MFRLRGRNLHWQLFVSIFFSTRFFDYLLIGLFVCSFVMYIPPPLSQTTFFTKQTTKLTFNQTLAQLAGALAAVFVALASVMNKLEKMFYDETGACSRGSGVGLGGTPKSRRQQHIF